MSDKAYSHEQVQQIIDNIEAARDRLKTLTNKNSRFGELEAYPFGLSLIPCGRITADLEGMRINESMKLLLEDNLTILGQYVECQQSDPQDEPTEDEECNELFTLIENLNVKIDYDRIQTDITTAKNETILKIDANGTKINNLTTISESNAEKIDSIAIRTDGIWGQINAITLAINGIRADLNKISEDVGELLECPCDANIIEAIRTSLDSLRNDLDSSITNISENINRVSENVDNINVDGADVNIDYQPIFDRFSLLDRSLQQYQASIITGQNTWGNNLMAAEQGTRLQLGQCCFDIMQKLDSLSFDLSPVLQAIASSRQDILQAIVISEDKIVSNITNARDTILSGQAEIQNVIVAEIDVLKGYLNRVYSGTITIQDKDKNEFRFPFDGVGLDGIHSSILSMVEAMEVLNNQKGDPCHSVALIYSERYPAHVLEDQLEITFIEEGTKWESTSINKRVTLHNPKENLDFCRDIYPLVIERGNKVYGRMDWSYAKPDRNGDLRIHKTHTAGKFRSETDAIAFLESVGKLSKIPPKPPRTTKNTQYKTVVATKRFRPVRAVLTRFDDDGETVLEKRCFEAPPEGCL